MSRDTASPSKQISGSTASGTSMPRNGQSAAPSVTTLVLTQLQTVRGFIKAFNASSAGNRPASGSVDEDSSTSRGKRGVFGRRAHTPEDK